jgi:regulator of RNase E activity RraA
MSEDVDLLTIVRTQLSTALLGDVLDAMGHTHQFLPPGLQPLEDSHMLAGYALTVLEADCVGGSGVKAESAAFGLMFQALDDLKPDEVYLCTGGSPRYALWGELMTARARELKAAGAVLDGFHRDTRGIVGQSFPVFSRGAYAQDQRPRGRVIDYRCAIEFSNGTRVDNGDLIVGDLDGVLAVPRAHAREAIENALVKLKGEGDVRDLIEAGQSTAGIFARTGIM